MQRWIMGTFDHYESQSEEEEEEDEEGDGGFEQEVASSVNISPFGLAAGGGMSGNNSAF